MRVLVVEDESFLAKQLTASIGEAGYAVDHAADGERADFLAYTEHYDAMVLDLGLPKIDGLTLLRKWRDAGLGTPVLVLTARGSWHDRVRGIDGGADDYVSKPFRTEEILARLRALIRRASGNVAPELRVGSVSLDPRLSRVTLEGEPVKLTSHEFRVLAYLMHHRGRVISQAELTEHIYAQGFDRDSNTVEVFIARLRRKLGASFIETVRGFRVSNSMSLVSLKAHVLVGAFLWTIGLFAVTGVFLHLLAFDHSSTHVASHSSRPAAAEWASWTFVRNAQVTAIVGGFSMLFGFLEIRRGMSPINELRQRLAAVHEGVDTRLSGRYPSEIQPLVDDMNALLDERGLRVARAIAKAGDLAHGLKTPLAVLVHEAQQVRAAGHDQLAMAIDQQIDRMRRQIDYHLAHARSAASSASPMARASIAASAEGLVRTLQRIYAERGLGIEIDASASHVFRGQREDVDEMLGNLLDNACKWARTEVRLTCSKEGQHVLIAVDDDGPGVEPSMRGIVMKRGVRADEAAQGSGFGLAIVRDLAEIYGGSVSLEESPLGGLRVQLKLPAQEWFNTDLD